MRVVEYHRLPGFHRTLAECEAWADERGLVLAFVHRGEYTGDLYGMAISPEAAMQDVATRAQDTLERAERLAEDAGR